MEPDRQWLAGKRDWIAALAAVVLVAVIGGYAMDASTNEETVSEADTDADTGDAGGSTGNTNVGNEPPRGSDPTPTPDEAEQDVEPDRLTVAACERWLVLRTEIESGHTTGTEARDGIKEIYDEYGRFAEVPDVRQAFSALLTAATQGDSDDVLEAADTLSGACDDANAT